MGRTRIILPLLFALLPLAAFTAEPQSDVTKVRLAGRTGIVVEGLIEKTRRATIMLDTGASCSVIRSALADKLKLRTLRDNVEFISLDRPVRRPLVVVNFVRLGPICRPVVCLAGDVSQGIDLILAIDVLKAYAFTVDYEHGWLLFGPGDSLEHSVVFDNSRDLAVVPLGIGTRGIRVLLDSGASYLGLFESKVKDWLQTGGWRFESLARGVSSYRRGMTIQAGDVVFAGVTIPALKATILESDPGSGASLDWDGYLGLNCLNARRVRFDFPNHIFSWEPYRASKRED